MGKVIVPMSVSLDGYFEGPDHSLDWSLVDEELHTYFNDTYREFGAFVEGRVTYELMASHWPAMAEDPDAGRIEHDFGRIWRDKPKYLVSRTVEESRWNTTTVRDVDPAWVREAASLGDVAVGGAELLKSFRSLGLVDEYWYIVHPVILGAGRQMFATGDRVSLELLENRTFGNGVVILKYATRR